MSNGTLNELSDLFFESIGSSWLSDGLFFLIIPISVIGLTLNLVSLVILHRVKLNAQLYTYLKVYTANSCVLCLMAVFLFIPFTPRYLSSLSLSYFARLYRCVILNYVATSLYFFGNILDIVINLDRLSLFIKVFDFFFSINIYLFVSLSSKKLKKLLFG
jgi:hypothetical protein